MDKDKPNLVQVDFNKEKTEQDTVLQQAIVNRLETLLKAAKEGRINQLVDIVEYSDCEVAYAVAGFSEDYFKMHYILDKYIPHEYENTFIIDHSYDE